MNKEQTLHFERLRKEHARIKPEISRMTAHDREFKAWQNRVLQSLKILFGEEHSYVKKFHGMSFWDFRVSMGPPTWSARDQHKFEESLYIAEQMLSDAIEELQVVPVSYEPPEPKTPKERSPSIVINVHNILSQSTDVQVSQIISNLNNLGLSKEQQQEAEKLAKELDAEAKGQQRWPVLAKSLEALKSLGKAVYEQIAIPLLLEMLKKQVE